MKFNYTPRRIWSGRCLVLFSFPAILLLIYALHWSLWDISAPLLGTYIVHDKTLSSLNNSSQQGVIDMNSQKMKNPSSSGQKGVADGNKIILTKLRPPETTDGYGQKMKRPSSSGQKNFTDGNKSISTTLRPPETTDGYTQKMKKPNSSGQKNFTDGNKSNSTTLRPPETNAGYSQKMKKPSSSGQKNFTDGNKSNSTTLRTPYTTDGYTQKMSRLKTLLQRRVAEDDPTLIQLIRTDFVFLPEGKPYNLKNPDVHDYSCGQSSAIDNVLNQTEKGFYIEAGAYDGESISNTLFFEKVRKWNGLLIEPDPFVFERLKAKNRKAILVNSCLNIKPQPSILEFNRGNEMGRVWVDKEDKNWVKEMKMKVNVIEVPCFSLYSILLAVNQTTIDYFSLDVEGRELSVLQSIPFDKIHIDTLTVEYLNGNDNNYYKDIKSFMEKNGYRHVQDLPGFGTCTARDSLFKKN